MARLDISKGAPITHSHDAGTVTFHLGAFDDVGSVKILSIDKVASITYDQMLYSFASRYVCSFPHTSLVFFYTQSELSLSPPLGAFQRLKNRRQKEARDCIPTNKGCTTEGEFWDQLACLWTFMDLCGHLGFPCEGCDTTHIRTSHPDLNQCL